MTCGLMPQATDTRSSTAATSSFVPPWYAAQYRSAGWLGVLTRRFFRQYAPVHPSPWVSTNCRICACGHRPGVVEHRVGDDVARIEAGARRRRGRCRGRHAGHVVLGQRDAVDQLPGQIAGHVLVLTEPLAGARQLDDVADLVVGPRIGVVARDQLEQPVVEHPGSAARLGARVHRVVDGVLLEQPQPLLVDRVGPQAGLLGGDRDTDLDAAAGDPHLLADRGDGGGHLHLLGVQRHPGEGAAARDTGRHVLQVAQRRRGPAAGDGRGFLSGRAHRQGGRGRRG